MEGALQSEDEERAKRKTVALLEGHPVHGLFNSLKSSLGGSPGVPLSLLGGHFFFFFLSSCFFFFFQFQQRSDFSANYFRRLRELHWLGYSTLL